METIRQNGKIIFLHSDEEGTKAQIDFKTSPQGKKNFQGQGMRIKSGILQSGHGIFARHHRNTYGDGEEVIGKGKNPECCEKHGKCDEVQLWIFNVSHVTGTFLLSFERQHGMSFPVICESDIPVMFPVAYLQLLN